jgi:hypothetical protein
MARWSRQLVIVLASLLCLPSVAFSASLGDPSMSSTNYGVIQSELGGSGCDPVISGTFCGSSADYSQSQVTDDGGSTLGESAVGNSSSTDYQTNSGYNTSASPGLMLVITNASTNLGTLSTAVKSTGTANFYVRDYTSSGYSVTMYGTSPTFHGYTMHALTTDTAYSSNTEEFGVNLVNDSVVSGSANPVCGPSGTPTTFCFYSTAAGNGSTGTYGTTRPYTIPNEFRFNVTSTTGEIVANSPETSGETDYTLSMMAGISNLTPAGPYQGSVTLVATGQY